jgi:hypothetical protein
MEPQAGWQDPLRCKMQIRQWRRIENPTLHRQHKTKRLLRHRQLKIGNMARGKQLQYTQFSGTLGIQP